LIWILLSVIFQSASIVSGKQAAISMEKYNIYSIGSNLFYMISLTFLLMQAIFWQQAIKNTDLNKAYMFMSSVQIIVIFASYFIFKEAINLQNILGSIVIIAGLNLLYKNIKSYKEI
jgi:drug/metabolite transporter (DMT)-like permease